MYSYCLQFLPVRKSVYVLMCITIHIDIEHRSDAAVATDIDIIRRISHIAGKGQDYVFKFFVRKLFERFHRRRRRRRHHRILHLFPDSCLAFPILRIAMNALIVIHKRETTSCIARTHIHTRTHGTCINGEKQKE